MDIIIKLLFRVLPHAAHWWVFSVHSTFSVDFTLIYRNDLWNSKKWINKLNSMNYYYLISKMDHKYKITTEMGQNGMELREANRMAAASNCVSSSKNVNWYGMLCLRAFESWHACDFQTWSFFTQTMKWLPGNVSI